MDNLETLIKNLAGKALSATQSADSGSSYGWVWKLIIGLVVAAGVLWLKYRLSGQARELAAARTKLEQDKVDAERTRLAATLTSNELKRAVLKATAKAKEASAAAKEAAITDLEKTHAELVAKTQSLQKWDDLNALAGVP